MPNWCSNALTVYGPTKDADSFHEAIKGEEDYDLTLPCPMPEILRGTRSPSQSVEKVEEDIANLIAKRDAGEMQAHENYTSEVTEGGSWVTDAYLQNMRDQAQQSVKAHEETGYYEWYRWACDNWGTKWPPDVHADVLVDVHEDGTSLRIKFDSAWAPPETLSEGLSELWPTLTFILDYSEPGMDFYGASAFVAGDRKYDNTQDYCDDPIVSALQVKIDSLYHLDSEGDGLTPAQWETEGELQDQIHERHGDLQAMMSSAADLAVT